jgi:hypothetical protein
MPAKTVLIDSATGQALHTEEYEHEGKSGRTLLITDMKSHYGVFTSASFTTATTTQIITPRGNGSVEITDLIVSFEKKNATVITISFHDGTNTVTIFKGTVTDAPINLAIPLAGKWQGWESAHIDITTSADCVGCISIGYLHKLNMESLSYNEWLARRT